MNDQAFDVARKLFEQIWESLGGEASWVNQVTFEGQGALRSPFAVTDLAAAAFASAATAAAELASLGGITPRQVTIDRRLASGWFELPVGGPSRRLDGEDLSGAIHPWMTEFQTADDKWLRVQGLFPRLRERLIQALGVEEDLDQARAVVRRYKAADVENMLVSAGAAAASSRSIDEWLAHEQGIAVEAEPIVDLRIGAPCDTKWRPVSQRPLAGVRVLDLTRVLSGPTATRFLAACGAEVLRLEAPDSDESKGMFGGGTDIGLGKRWAFLDLRTDLGKERFYELLSGADVLVHGYRPGALEGLGITQELRDAARPGLVEVSLNAYGWTGPWANRRGFDTLVQYSCGLAQETTDWALRCAETRVPIEALGRMVQADRPRHMPVEALDFATGYQVAAAAIRGISRRVTDGVGSRSRLSLAKTASLLIAAGEQPEDEVIRLPLNGPYEERIYSSGGFAAHRMQFPARIDGVPLFWERSFEAAGASTPTWATPQ